VRLVERAPEKPRWFQRTLNRVADGLLEVRNPRAASERRFWRANAHKFARMAGASTNRVLADWMPQGGDADADTVWDLPATRKRCRDAALNDPIYRAIRSIVADYVVGSGIRPKAEIDADRLGLTPDQAEEWEGAVDEFVARNLDAADITGRTDWVGLQRLCYLSVFDGGDVFPSFPMPAAGGREVRTAINLIEAERVVDPYGSSPRITAGVEVDSWGRPIAYHIQRGHPGAMQTLEKDHAKIERWLRVRRTSAGIPRTNIVQVYEQDRIGQSRGVPFMAAALPLLDGISQYVDEVLLQARLQNSLSVWIQTTGNPEVFRSAMRDEVTYDGLSEKRVESGSINVLKAGDEARFMDPATPGSFFDDLIVRLLRIICASVGASYEMTFDVGGANYSSIRMGALRFRQRIAAAQSMVLQPFRVWRAHAIYEGWLDGLLPPVPFEAAPELWTACGWTRPVMPWVDPTKDVQAEVMQVDAGFKSVSQVIRERGGEPSSVARERAAERADLPANEATPAPTPATQEPAGAGAPS
jgi:lambda family phage portal protein